MRKKSFISALIILFSFISGCGQEKIPPAPPTDYAISTPTPEISSLAPVPTDHEIIPNIQIPPDDTAVINQSETIVSSEVFLTLSSEELEGRKMGSAGSKKAQDLICSLFEKMQLKPFGESYKSEIFMNQSPRVASSAVITYDDQTVSSLIASQDYFIAPGKAFSGEYRVVYRELPPADEKVIFIIDDENGMKRSVKSDQAIGFIHQKSPLFRSVERGPADDLHLFVSEDIITRLKNYDGKAMLSVSVPEAQNIDIIEGNNIIGRLPGKNSNECIIISAHYDGSENETAALDNASGTYTLLRTAEKLSEYSNFNKLSRDVIFAVFDGEEQGLIGSGYLAEKIKNSYESTVVINIDCVGLEGSDSYMAVGDTTKFKEFVDSLYQMLDSNEFGTVPVNLSYASDHLSFEWQGITAATIGERDVEGIIHTKNDVAANIDIDELERLCDAIFAFVLEYR